MRYLVLLLAVLAYQWTWFGALRFASQDMALNGDNVTECKATKPVPSCGVFSWAFTQTPLAVAPPFLRPFNSTSKPSSSNYVCPNPNTILRDIQSSIMSTTDKCFKLLHLFASENPVLKKLLAWSSEFHTIRKQVRNSHSLLFTTLLVSQLEQCWNLDN